MSSTLQVRYSRLVGRVSWLWLQVWLLTRLTILQLVVFQLVVPPWQHFDEPAHFRHAWSLVNLTPAQQAAAFTPLDPTMVRDVLGSMVENAFYRELTAPNYLRTHGLDTLGHSQSVEFRMYYDWVGWPLRMFREADITTQLLAGRAVTSLRGAFAARRPRRSRSAGSTALPGGRPPRACPRRHLESAAAPPPRS